MAEQQSTQKLVNELSKAVKETKQIVSNLEDADAALKSMAKSLKESSGIFNKDTAKGQSEFNKAISLGNTLLEKQEDINKEKKKTNDDLAKQEKELIKLKKRFADSLSEEVSENEKLKIQIQEQNKVRKQQLKQSLGLLDTYQKESFELNRLRKQWKNLAAQNKSNTKEGKALLKNITELDEKLKEIDKTVGQNQRTVGEYERAVKGLNNTINKLGITALIVKGIELLTGAFGDSRDGALELEKAMNNISAVVKVTISSIVAAVPGLKNIFSAVTDTFDSFGVKAEIAFLKIQKGIKSLSFDDTDGIDNKIESLKIQLGELSESSVVDGVNTIVDAFDDFGDRIVKTRENLNTSSKLIQDYDIQIQSLERSISKLNKSQTLQLQLAENDTLSFQIREAASKRAVDQAIELGKLQEERARLELEEKKRLIAIELQAAGVIKNANSQTSESIIALLKVRKNAGKISSELEQGFTDAFISNQEARLESGELLADTLEKQNKLYNDAAQAQLDIQVDALDNQKSINERIISSDKETFDRRSELLKKNNELFETGFKAQQETLIDLNNRIIDSEKLKLKVRREAIEEDVELSKEAKKEALTELDLQDKKLDSQKELLTAEEIVRIAKIENAVLQAEEIKNLKLNEKTIIDLLTIIRDYRTGTQDLTESTQDYNDTLKEENQLLKEIEIQERKLSGERINIDKELRKARIKVLKEEIAAIEGSTLEKSKLQKELNELLLEEEEENLAKRKELIETGVTLIEDVLKRASDKRVSLLDKELEATEKNINRINEAIANGSEGATDSLAVEQEKQRKLQQDRERELKRAQRIEASIAVLKVFAANADDPNALGKTISDTTALLAFISSIQGFIEGTENVGESMQGNKIHNGTDGYIAKFDGRERILNPEQNAMIGSISNDELAELGQMYNNGMVGSKVVVAKNDNRELVHEVKEMTKVIKNMPVPDYNFIAHGNYHQKVLKSANKVEKLMVRANDIYK